MFKNNKITFATRKKSYGNFLLSFIFIFTFILIFFNKTDYFLVSKVKGFGIDFVSPITRFISSPVTIISNINTRLNDIQNLEITNLKLKEEIFRLKKWQTLAIKNSRENRVFKRLLNSTSHEVDVIKTASVINQSPGMYSNMVTINAGMNYNIESNLAVINEKGLVGKIIFSTNKNSKVLLINDQTSAIPVKTLSDGSYSILSGTQNGKFLKSTFSEDNKLPKIGDLIVTSGNAKIFPRDILVAKVVKILDDHYIALPYVDFDNLNYVQVVKSK